MNEPNALEQILAVVEQGADIADEATEHYGNSRIFSGLALGLTLAMEHPEYARALYGEVKFAMGASTEIFGIMIDMLTKVIPIEAIVEKEQNE